MDCRCIPSLNMSQFSTFNQFDEKFKLSQFGGECNACPVFALFTAKKFMDNGNVSKEQHEKNLEAAVMNYILNENTKELPKYLSFGELLMYTGGIYNDTNGTTPELINQFGYDPVFEPEENNQNHAIIFLKNGNFIVVLIKQNEGGSKFYCVRDCHETEQYNFDTFDALKVHLSTKYQFNELTVVDGFLIEEYANIEYLVIDKPFPIIILDISLYDDENKVEVDDDNGYDMSINLDGFSPEELKQMGIMKPPEDVSALSIVSSASGASGASVVQNAPTANPGPGSGDLSLDELIAMQLQFGEE